MLRSFSGLLVILAFLPAMALGQTLMYYWNFNDNVPGSNQNWQQPIPAHIGDAEITYTFTEAFSFGGTTINGIEGEVSGGSLAPRGGLDNVNNGEHFTMAAPTTGYQDIELSYPTRRTSTGFHTQEIKYTIDGSTWITKETVDISGFQNNWVADQLITVSFAGVAGVDNNPNFAIRIVLTGATSAAGNNRFDNIRISGSAAGAISPPSDFLATAVSTSQIDLSWLLNANNNPVLLAWSADGTFGNPSGSYNPGDAIAGGGVVLLAGSNTSFSHTGLDAGTTYYYKAWSYAGTEYSGGVTANATTDPDPVFAVLPYSETFDDDLGDCYTYNVSGPTKFWVHAITAGNGFAMMNGFNSGELEEDWLILPGINMNEYSNVILNFETAWNFGIEDANNYLKLYYSTNYTGTDDPTLASWTELEFTKPASGGYTWQNSGNLSLSGIEGIVWVGFKYHYSEEYRRWQVDNVNIFEADSPLLTAEPGELSGFAYEVGSGPSAEQSFAVSGSNLVGNITIAPPASYETSLESGAGFSSNPIVLPHVGGTVEATPVYVRLMAGLEIGDYNEAVSVTSPDAGALAVNLSGSVSPEVVPPLSIDDPEFMYMQDFNTLAMEGTGNPWTDNETLTGWYWQCQNSDRDPNNVGYWAQDGSNNNVQATSFGSDGSVDRAFGSISGGSNRNFLHGVQFRNNTANPINLSEIYITYTGEQWRQTPNQHTLEFSYGKSATIISDLLAGNWTPNTNLDFVAPKTGDAGPLNGNAPENRVEFLNVPLAAEGVLEPGEYIMLRWFKTGATAPGLAIDDFIFSLTEVIIIENPINFSAAALSTSEISLEWELNSNNDPVMLAWSADGAFGTPEGTYQVGDPISGGGVVLYAGSDLTFLHQELDAGTTYYYRAWSMAGDVYSSGTATSATTMPDPAFTPLPYIETFDQDLGDCYVYSVSGPTKYWIHSTFDDNGFASMNGFNSGDLEVDWLILPGINFDFYTNESMSFDTWFRYGEDNETNYLKLYYSADYPGTGDPGTATWTELEFTRPAEEQTWVSSGDIDLSGITGELVYIGLKYQYEPDNYRWWQVDNISITGDASAILPGDANCDGLVNIIDAVITVNFILGNNPQPFCFENADVNGDGQVNTIDVIGIINIILGSGTGIN